MVRAFRYILTMLPSMAGALLFLIPIRIWQAQRLRRRGAHTTSMHELCLLFFCAYLVGVASLTILPPWELITGFRLPQNYQSEINLIPFRVFSLCWGEHLRTGHWDYLFINLVGNLVIFFPMGFFPALLWKRFDNWRGAAKWGLICSLTIELCQLPLDRCTDIDDLWTNLLGALLGYGLYRLCRHWTPGLERTARIRR